MAGGASKDRREKAPSALAVLLPILAKVLMECLFLISDSQDLHNCTTSSACTALSYQMDEAHYITRRETDNVMGLASFKESFDACKGLP